MYDLENYKQEIWSIRLLYESIPYSGLNIKKTVTLSANQLLFLYDQTQDSQYLLLCALHIKAYLELGFPYDAEVPSFRRVLKLLGKSEKEFTEGQNFAVQKVRLTRSRIRCLLGRWPASPYNSHKKEEAVNDIIEKVESQTYGCFSYYSSYGHPIKTFYFELIITENSSLLHDMQKHIYYSFA